MRRISFQESDTNDIIAFSNVDNCYERLSYSLLMDLGLALAIIN